MIKIDERHLQESIIPITKQSKSRCRSEQYRLDIIAEILHAGNVAFGDLQELIEQINLWSAALSEIDTDNLIICFTAVKRNRAACDVPFDRLSLTMEEMKQAGEILK